jgi:LPS-assembly protein
MSKLFVASVFFITLLYSDANRIVEILSGDIRSDGSEIFADNDSVILSDGVVVQSDKLHFDKNSSVVDADGNVFIVKDGNIYLTCSKAKVDIKDESLSLEPFFLYDEKNDIWIKSKKSDSKNRIYRFDKSIVSSCSVEDPEWSIRFSSGDLNSRYEWLNLYNARLYIKDVPIFYLPYFGFSTNTKRRSGLLSPQFYFSNDEGIYYSQPMFIAPYDNWDIEIEPHIRTKRGYGGYTTFRFVDTNSSEGSVKFGGFKEDGTYAQEFDLKNDDHYGYQVKYKNSNMLHLGGEYNNGIYLDYESFNDIDYKNLQSKESLDIKEKIATSKLNYYLKNNEYYGGFYARYFINTETTQDENEKTLQNLPTIQLHKFSDNLFFDNISYSTNYNYENFYRPDGLRAYKNEVYIPIEISVPIVNDYIILSAKENIVLSEIKYLDKNSTDVYDDGSVFRENYQFGAVVDLSRRYDSIFHNFKLEAIYTKPVRAVQNGDIYGLTSEDENLNFTSFPVDNENVKFGFSQYFYKTNGSLILSHLMSQQIDYDEDEQRYADLDNEIVYNINSHISINNRLFFNHDSQKVTSMSSGISYKSYKFNSKLTHIYQNLPKNKYNPKADYYTLKFDKKFVSYFTVFGKAEYDKIDDYYKKLKLGFIVDKRCISYKLAYSKSIEHSLTEGNIDTITSNKIFFELNFKPAGKQSYAYEEIQKGNI